MKLRAIRVKEFRRFRTGVAVEAIRDGINILAGPNEMGKSTLFDALEAAFLRRSRITGADLDIMRPMGGGEPLVEVDFERDGRQWRLRKQFGRGATSSLIDAATGVVAARNTDAEDRIAELLAKTGTSSGNLAGILGLVWVQQKRTLLPPDPDRDPQTGKARVRGEYATLMDLVSAEVDSVVRGDLFNGVRQRVTTALENLVTTSRGAARKHGPLEQAQVALAAARDKLAEAERAAALADDRRATLLVIEAELSHIDQPTLAAKAAREISDVEQRLTAAVAARTDRDLAIERLRMAQRDVALAEKDAVEAQRRDIAIIDLQARMTRALEIEREVLDLAAASNTNAVTPAILRRASELENRIAVLAAKMAAASATVEIAVMDGGRNRIRVDGVAVDGDRTLTVADRVAIDVDGIAAIRVILPGGADATAIAHQHDDHTRALSELFASLGLTSLETVKATAEIRTGLIEALDAARLELAAVAPKGSARLANELLELKAAQLAIVPAVDDGVTLEMLKAAVARHSAAVATATAAALDDQAYRDLVAVAAKIRDQEASRRKRVGELALKSAQLVGEQKGADEDGRATTCDLWAGAVTRAQAEVERLLADVRALQMLDGVLSDIEAASRRNVFEPLLRRLTPHLIDFFGDAKLSFKDQFAVDTLERNGTREPVAALSEGTREQISVLVRLSYAEALADLGQPVPLVLDDPLVYSDDDRMRDILDVLRRATSVPQILVLTCRATAFAPLPANHLTMTPWQAG